MVDNQKIVEYLKSKQFTCQELEIEGVNAISVSVNLSGNHIELIHFPLAEITEMPIFLLLKLADIGHLAHVFYYEKNNFEYGTICVNDRDSVSVNFNMPLLAIEESLNRHIDILNKAISDPIWNRNELLREFQSCWLRICDFDNRPILLTNDSALLEEIDVFRPLQGAKYGVASFYLAQSANTHIGNIAKIHWQKNSRRSIAGKAIVLPLTEIEPAPLNKNQLTNWYLDILSKQKPEILKKLTESYGRWKANEYWIFFNAQVPSGTVWFCLSFKNAKNKKHSLPLTKQQLDNWNVKAVPISLFNKEAVLPRGGANLDLASKKVALIGAGSVGSEIAHKLSAAGVQDLTIYDPDVYNIENLYRHILPEEFLNYGKSFGLSFMIQRQFLWSQSKWSQQKLLDLRDWKQLSSYDLIIIAIGSPTHERIFKEYLLKNRINTPTINTWLEGFGVGGHAIIDIPTSEGCFLCAYVCPDTFTRGLSSNLNFIEPNQNITINMSGCGEQFISYGAICSAQTALIASNLAIKYLEGKLQSSSKVSWKGDDHDALKHGITLTNRFYQFTDSLLIKPLVHEDCDVCGK